MAKESRRHPTFWCDHSAVFNAAWRPNEVPVHSLSLASSLERRASSQRGVGIGQSVLFENFQLLEPSHE